MQCHLSDYKPCNHRLVPPLGIMSGHNLRRRDTTLSYKDSTSKPTALKNPNLKGSTKSPRATPSTVNSSINRSKSASVSNNSTPAISNNTIGNRIDLIESRVRTIEESVNQRSEVEAIGETVGRLHTENAEQRETISQLKLDLGRLITATEENKVLAATVATLKSEIAALRSEVSNLKLSNSSTVHNQHSGSPSISVNGISAEQRDINSNVVIRGVELSESDPEKVFDSIRTHLGINEETSFDPVSVKVLPLSAGNSSATRTIRVKFHSVSIKRQFLQIRRTKKDITPAHLGLAQQSTKSLLITEQLTRANQRLLYAARSLRHSHKYKFVWSNDGQVLVRQQQHSKVIRIVDIDQVNGLRSEIGLPPLQISEDGRLSA